MRRIDVNLISRVEGHGNLKVTANGGEVEDVRLEVVEPARFFEVLVTDRSFRETPWMVQRICGICSVSHTMSSLKAVEKAVGFTPSPQTVLLRKLLLGAEYVRSHISHLFVLVLPDYIGEDGVASMVQGKNRPLAAKAARLVKRANEAVIMLGGRAFEPQRPVPGGWTTLPTPRELHKLKEIFEDLTQHSGEAVAVFKKLGLPEMHRPGRHLALSHPEEYALYDGDLAYWADSKVQWQAPPDKYRDIISEEVRGYSSTKFSSIEGKPFMVGPIARMNVGFDKLSPGALKVAKTLKLAPPIDNPFSNNWCQLVELVHCLEWNLRLIEDLLALGVLEREQPELKPRKGRGVGVVEACRGILIHDYELGADGLVKSGNIITPTAENVGSIEDDVAEYLPGLLPRGDEEVKFEVEKLLRAYDPCFSCSVHLIDAPARPS